MREVISHISLLLTSREKMVWESSPMAAGGYHVDIFRLRFQWEARRKSEENMMSFLRMRHAQ